MFSRFDPAAKRVLRAAEQASRNHNHYYVGVEHLVLALLEERDPAIEARLAPHGTSAADIIGELRGAIGTGDDRSWEGILLTPRVRLVILDAEASVPGGEPVAPVHIFDAAVAQGRGLAVDVLARFLDLRAPQRASR